MGMPFPLFKNTTRTYGNGVPMRPGRFGERSTDVNYFCAPRGGGGPAPHFVVPILVFIGLSVLDVGPM